MDLIVCIDERNGMCFAGRRQSSDRLLREDLLAMTQGVTLWMAPYSAKQVEALPENVRVTENFMEEAGVGEYCFCVSLEPTLPGRCGASGQLAPMPQTDRAERISGQFP